MPTTTDDAQSNWRLERYILGELPAEEMEAVKRLLTVDATARDRLRSIERSNADILRRHPAHLIAASIRARLDTSAFQAARPERSFVLRPAAALAMVAAVTLVTVGVSYILRERPIGPPSTDGTRIKGLRPRLLLFRQTPQGTEALAVGSAAKPNDVIQLAYQAAGQHYGVIVSIDGRGVVTRHLPASGSQAVALKAGGLVALPLAYRLDDAPRFERFWLVTSNQPFEVDTIVDVARRSFDGADSAPTASLPLPSAFDQSAFVLSKEP